MARLAGDIVIEVTVLSARILGAETNAEFEFRLTCHGLRLLNPALLQDMRAGSRSFQCHGEDLVCSLDCVLDRGISELWEDFAAASIYFFPGSSDPIDDLWQHETADAAEPPWSMAPRKGPLGPDDPVSVVFRIDHEGLHGASSGGTGGAIAWTVVSAEELRRFRDTLAAEIAAALAAAD